MNNRSLEDALAVVFGETPSFPPVVVSASGASVEQATQVAYDSVSWKTGLDFVLHRQNREEESLPMATRLIPSKFIVDRICFFFRTSNQLKANRRIPKCSHTKWYSSSMAHYGWVQARWLLKWLIRPSIFTKISSIDVYVDWTFGKWQVKRKLLSEQIRPKRWCNSKLVQLRIVPLPRRWFMMLDEPRLPVDPSPV